MSADTRNHQEYQLIDDSYQDIFDEDAGEIVCRICTLSISKWKYFFYHTISILLIGIPYVIFKSFPKYKSRLKYNKCCPEDASHVLVHDNHGNYSIEELLNSEVNLEELNSNVHIKYFIHQHTKYIWSKEKRSFVPLEQLLWKKKTCEEFIRDEQGLTERKYVELFKLFDRNKITIEVKSYWGLFIEEIFNPFYLFQAFAIIIWCIDDYRIYAGCIVVLTLLSSITSLIQMRKQSVNLRNIVESSKCHEVTVLRSITENIEVTFKIDPEELVPGDLIVLPASDYIMPCDAVLLTGQCIVNESVLTGESIPVTKIALPLDPEVYSLKTHKRHTLFSGTTILQTRFYGGKNVLARVVRTGFDTTKGHLVKSILFPTPINLQFYKDSFKFVYVLFLIALSGMVYCIYLYVERHADLEAIILRTLDIITIVVPPALPAAMTIGTVYSQTRLKKLKIFCISPPRIIVCGKIKLACFDKTGTLTHEGLIMNSVLPCTNNAQFFINPITDISGLDNQSKFVQGMATCHSLTRIDGNLNGDPLDLNMFEFTKWSLEEPAVNETARFDLLVPTVVSCPTVQENEESSQIGIIKEFSFSSTQQCMSVIVKDLSTTNTIAFTKGAPEKIFGLCIKSTLPKDFHLKLSFYTAKGFRVIALAYKDLPTTFKWKDAQKVKRHVIECDLHFLGFLILQNPLKIETTPAIKTLQEANVRTVMITGDNIMTAISVARDCGMVLMHEDIYILNFVEANSINEIPHIVLERTGTGMQACGSDVIIDVNISNYHLAIDGKTWAKLKTFYQELIPNLLIKTTIFARFQPDQKTQLITSFQELDYIVSMVGDGANDCGALKAAHVGVSLSPAEASVAAPFTSGIPNISCLVKLILEGRCSLVTSFAVFKYMALYSLIQFFSVLILYRCYSTLGDYQFLFIDMILITSLAVTIGRQGPFGVLCRKGPLSSLVSSKCLLPLILQIITSAVFQIGGLWFLYQQNWFKPISPNHHEEVIESWENTVIFMISSYQYIILAWHMSKGRPYRKIVLTNYLFMSCVISLTILITWMVIFPCKKVAEFMEIIYEKHKEQRKFIYYLLLFPMIHFILAGLIEVFIGISFIKAFKKFICYKPESKSKYKRLLSDERFSEYLNSLQISTGSE